jgi:transcription elongation factor Elf1
MKQETSPDPRAVPGRTARTTISCPGCGRHDHVTWPADQPVYHWTCFNCHGSFELRRQGGH